ncbi:hypothetical protein [Phocaeicola barnesiae]
MSYIISKPAASGFAAALADFVIDSDKTVSFEVQYKGNAILAEEYVPDASNQVVVRKIGKFCNNALWGSWPSGNSTVQTNQFGTFTFLVDGQTQSSLVVFSRTAPARSLAETPFLSSAQVKVTRPDVPEWVSGLFSSGETVTVKYSDTDGKVHSATLYTHSGSQGVVTLDCSYSRVKSLLGGGLMLAYQVVRQNGGLMTFCVDHSVYPQKFVFRAKNNFDVPESVVCVGPVELKGGDNSETGYMFGIERKFIIRPDDELTASSGHIFMQSEYRIWRDFLNAQEAQIQIEGTWYDIIITKQNYTRTLRNNRLDSVEFSFRFADPDNNGIL